MRARAARRRRRRARRSTRNQVRSLTEQYDTAARYTLDRVGEILRLLEHAGVYRAR